MSARRCDRNFADRRFSGNFTANATAAISGLRLSPLGSRGGNRSSAPLSDACLALRPLAVRRYSEAGGRQRERSMMHINCPRIVRPKSMTMGA